MKKLILFFLIAVSFCAMSADNVESVNPDNNCGNWQLMESGKYCRICTTGLGTYYMECRACPYCIPE